MHSVAQPHHLGFNLRERRTPPNYDKINGTNSLLSTVWKQNNALTSAHMICGLQMLHVFVCIFRHAKGT